MVLQRIRRGQNSESSTWPNIPHDFFTFSELSIFFDDIILYHRGIDIHRVAGFQQIDEIVFPGYFFFENGNHNSATVGTNIYFISFDRIINRSEKLIGSIANVFDVVDFECVLSTPFNNVFVKSFERFSPLDKTFRLIIHFYGHIVFIYFFLRHEEFVGEKIFIDLFCRNGNSNIRINRRTYISSDVRARFWCRQIANEIEMTFLYFSLIVSDFSVRCRGLYDSFSFL